jgi:hypothetical protein
VDSDFDVHFAAPLNDGDCTIGQAAADHQGQNVTVILVELLQRVEYVPGFFPNNIQPLLIVRHVRRQFLKGDLWVLPAHMVIKTIPGNGEEQGGT